MNPVFIQMIFVEDVDISGIIGIQYMFDSNFFAQARFAQGLTRVNISGPDTKNQVISFSLGFFLDNAAESEDQE